MRACFAAAVAVLACGALFPPPPAAAAQPRRAAPAANFVATLRFAYSPSPAGMLQGQGYRPSPLPPVTVAPSARLLAARGIMAGAGAASLYPARFDLRRYHRVSPVRDQGLRSTCWAFASLGALESTLLPAEKHYFSVDNLCRQSGFDWGANGGGNDQMAAAYLLRWSGPVNASSEPYGSAHTPPRLSAVKHVQSWVRLPEPSAPRDLNIIKGELEHYGALYAVIDFAPRCYRAASHAYYYSGPSAPNHAIDIVGWDDRYAAKNFAKRPPGNGAFLCRNSWGRAWGAKGYFWVSYYDALIDTDVSVFPRVEAVSNYARCYQYDPLGETDNLGWTGSQTGWFANSFTALANESLAAVGFGVPSGDAGYVVYAGPSLAQLTPVASGTTAFAGFTTVELNMPVALAQGSPFVVAVQQTTPQYGYPVPAEAPIAGYDSLATAAPGQSFVSPDGTHWTDLCTVPGYAATNVCLKAYTRSRPRPAKRLARSSVTDLPDGDISQHAGVREEGGRWPSSRSKGCASSTIRPRVCWPSTR